MRAFIRVGSFHWVIVDQIEDPETSYLLAEGECFNLFGLSNEQYEFKIIRIEPATVEIEITGSYLVLVNEEKCVGDGQIFNKIHLKTGESRKLATPTLDAGIVWDIRLEEIINNE